MAAPGASFPAHLQTNRRTEAHQQRLLQVQAELLAAKHPILSNGPGAKPAGLYNEGNTCFFNSTFQALAATTSLIDLVGPVIFPYTSSTANAAAASSAASAAEASSTTANDSDHTTPHLPPEVQALDHPAKSYTSLATGSDGYPLYPHSIPSLLDAALEPEHAKLLPVTLAFEKCLGKAWKAKDEGLKEAERAAANKTGEDGSGAGAGGSAEKEKSVSLKALLRELGRKYDQYEDYRQQDAHELLRHLLDSMSMEEKDLIKVLQPPSPTTSGHLRPGHGQSKRTRQRNSHHSGSSSGVGAGMLTHTAEGEEQVDGVLVKDRMIPFADALFGGSLVSVVICQGCKSVSHTYEGFMDISLSIGKQQPKVRKRDRIKAVFKLGSHKTSGPPPSAPSSGAANGPSVYLEGVHEAASAGEHHDSTTADEEGSGYRFPGGANPHVGGGRKESVTSTTAVSMTSGSEAPSVSAGFFGNKLKRDSMDSTSKPLKKRTSLSSWTGKRRGSRPSTTSSIDSTDVGGPGFGEPPHRPSFGATTGGGSGGQTPIQGQGGQQKGISSIYPFSGFRSNETTPTSSRRNSQVGLALDSSLVAESIEEEDATKPPKPRPEQAAYIRRLLNGPNLPPRAMDDPLERLRSGMAQMQVQQGLGASSGQSAGEGNGSAEGSAGVSPPAIDGLETDLMDSMKNFTAVEVLEGDNAFACHKCWRYKTGRGGRRRKLAKMANVPPAGGTSSSSSDSEDQQAAQPAKGHSVAFAEPRVVVPEIAVTTDDEPMGRVTPTQETVVPNSSLTANRSPRPSTTGSVETDRLTVVSSNSGRSGSGTSGYQTSSEESSDEGPVGRLSVVRPPPPQRRKSQHFVLQRAFKRYMIARAPPVLVFHFKRFQQSSKQSAANMYSGSFAALKKIDDFVSFPERIDLSPFLAPERQDYKVVIGPDGVGRAKYQDHPPGDTGPELVPMRYRLYAVVVHLGLTAISGHYVCYVLVDPGVIIKSRADSATSSDAQDTHCEPDMAAAAVADPMDGTSPAPHPVDNRVWCYCSEYVPPFLACQLYAQLTLLAGVNHSTSVRLASLDEVLKAKAYMCFYEKTK